MSGFDLSTSVGECNIPVVRVSGDLDSYSAPRLRRVLNEMLLVPKPRIVLQCEGLEYIDSSGLGVLVSALKTANDRSGTVGLAAPQLGVSRVLRITGLDKIIPIYRTEQEACGKLGSS